VAVFEEMAAESPAGRALTAEAHDATSLGRFSGNTARHGWMPTALDIYPNPPNIGLEAGGHLLTKAKIQGSLTNKPLADVWTVYDNSGREPRLLEKGE